MQHTAGCIGPLSQEHSASLGSSLQLAEPEEILRRLCNCHPHTLLYYDDHCRRHDHPVIHQSSQSTDQVSYVKSSEQRLRLGTRGSSLARWQADWVAAQLRQLGAEIEIVLITTSGDATQQPLSAVGGQGLFTKEIQRALLDDRVDLAVHSLKDLPTEPVDGLALAGIPTRESPHDVLVLPRGGQSSQRMEIEQLRPGARIGTGSRRRQSQMRHFRADLEIHDIRGNVDTRLRRLDSGDFDAIVLAEAGLNRLGLAERISQIIPPTIMLPAVGQGALGIETRTDDGRARSLVAKLDDPATRAAVLAERALLAGLRGGCLAPVGAWGRLDGSILRLSGAVLSADGKCKVSVSLSGAPPDCQQIGQQAADELLKLGAGELIAEARN